MAFSLLLPKHNVLIALSDTCLDLRVTKQGSLSLFSFSIVYIG